MRNISIYQYEIYMMQGTIQVKTQLFATDTSNILLAMKQYYFMFFICLSLIFFTSTSSSTTPRLHHLPSLVSTNIKDVHTYFYKQTLDHFDYRPERSSTFDQRYLINFKYWSGANSSAPVFVYLGAQDAIDNSPYDIGFMTDNAASFKALLVYIEHRYYGQSVPFGSKEEALKNASTLAYLDSAQAIADYADVLIHIQETLQTQKSPVVVIGGSYGGILASLFKLRYPHLAIGALASSAPILYIDIILPNAYMDIVSKDFKEASQTCFETIKKSWPEIDRIASLPNGLFTLSERFNICNPLNHSSELSSYLEEVYAEAAQYNRPPDYPVTEICNGIAKASFGKTIIDKIYSGIVAYRKEGECQVLHSISESDVDWDWQTCTEMVMPYGKGNNTMFQPFTFDLKRYTENCKKKYGVSPRPHWISTFYGGQQNLTRILQRFGSNIIFSNGLKDPYSSGGILNDISDSIVAVYTINGSHCLDILSSRQSDPDWLIEQRKREVEIIQRWMVQYNSESKSVRNNVLFHLSVVGFLMAII